MPLQRSQPPKLMSSSSEDDTAGTCSPSDGAGDGDAGLVEGAFGAGLRRSGCSAARRPARCSGLLESSATLPGVAEVRISAFSGGLNRRQAVRIGAEAALVRVAAGGVEHHELGARALLLHRRRARTSTDCLRGGRRLPSRSWHRPGSCSSRGRPARRSRRRTASPRCRADLGLQPARRRGACRPCWRPRPRRRRSRCRAARPVSARASLIGWASGAGASG